MANKPRSWTEKNTEDKYLRLEHRIRRVFREASDDLAMKQQSFVEGHERRDAKYRAQVEAGMLSKADYQAWMRGQVFQGEQWEYKRGQLARILVNADEIAANLINTGKLEIFADNADHMLFSIEKNMHIDTPFGLFNREAVARILLENPDMLPRANPAEDDDGDAEAAAIRRRLMGEKGWAYFSEIKALPPRNAVDEKRDFAYYNEIIQNAVIQGILQGETINDIALRITREAGEKAFNNARRNARTAYTCAQNAGSLYTMRRARDELGLKLQKRWMATLDDRTRDAHADLDGQVRDIDEPFDSMLGEIMYPGDMDADPANVWNCRCYMDEFYPGSSNAMYRYDASGDYAGDVTYKEWLQLKGVG